MLLRDFSRMKNQEASARRTFSLWIKQFGEARIFLQERKVFVVSGVIAILWPKLNGDLQIFHGRIGFPGKAIKRRHGVNHVVGLGRGLCARDPSLSAASSHRPRFINATPWV